MSSQHPLTDDVSNFAPSIGIRDRVLVYPQGVWRRLPVGGFGRSVAVLAGGTALGQAIALAAAPLLTRLYSPEDFGVLGVYASLLGIFAVIASLRYDLAIPIPEDDRDAASLVVLALAIIPISSLALGVVVWLFADQLVSCTQSPGLQPYLWLLPVGVALWGTYNVFNFWAIRRKAFSRIARTKLAQAISMVSTQLLLFPIGAVGLLFGHVASGAAGIGTLATLARRHDGDAFGGLSSRTSWRMAIRYRRFPLYSAAAGLVNTAGVLSPLLIVSALYGPLPAGQFALVQRVVWVPLGLIGTSVAQVYISQAAEALRLGPHVLRKLFIRTSIRLAIAGAIPATVLLVSGPWIFTTVFGPQWTDAGRWARVLGFMLGLQMVASPVSQTFNVLEHQNWQLAWDIARLLLLSLSFWAAYRQDWSVDTAIFSYALSMSFAYALLWIVQFLTLQYSRSE